VDSRAESALIWLKLIFLSILYAAPSEKFVKQFQWTRDENKYQACMHALPLPQDIIIVFNRFNYLSLYFHENKMSIQYTYQENDHQTSNLNAPSTQKCLTFSSSKADGFVFAWGIRGHKYLTQA